VKYHIFIFLGCTQTFEKHQVRLRHFIWAHQDLERLVIQDFNVKLSEFMPSAKDLEMVKQKNERKGESAEEDDKKDLTGLEILPVHERIDLKLTVPR
jgi:hypothetical protein